MPQVNLNLNAPTSIAIQASQALIANIANQYIVSTNGAPAGVSGFVFDVIDLEEISLQSDITDHWIETNSAIQDHIAQKPLRFTLKGFVGEIKNILQVPDGNVFYNVAGLAPLNILSPVFNVQDTQTYENIATMAAQAQAVIASIPNISSLVPQLIGTLTFQQQAYAQLSAMWINRVLCTVQTPFGLLTSMAIEDLRPSQPGDTRMVSGFNITFKQIQQVGTAVTMNTTNGTSTTVNPASPNPVGSGTQVGNTSSTNLVQSPSANTNPAANNSNIGIVPPAASSSNRFTDMTEDTPPLPGPSSSGITAPPLENFITPTSQTLSTLPATVPVPMVMGL